MAIWVHLVIAFVGGFIGAICGVIVKHRWEMRGYPYRYLCPNPNCGYEVRANEMVLLETLASSHEHATAHNKEFN